MKKIFLLLLFFNSLQAQFRQMNGAELQLAINKLSVLGSVLYVAAHPDDENTALLSYFAKGKLLRTGYLSVTRGEGGQNLLGAEQGTELGVIRTQELLAARKIDGAEQFFTNAIDFGFSKSADEALRFWNKDSVLQDMVWVIRKFRPDIIITRFSPTIGGHGHHLASAILAEEAFKISGDTNFFPEQLQFVQPWKAKRLLYNRSRFDASNVNPANAQTIKIDIGEYSPLLGKSFTEISGISRTMHKSQAMGSAQNKGSSINEFEITAGELAKSDLLEGIDISWNRIRNSKNISSLISEIQKKYNSSNPQQSISALVKLHTLLKHFNNEPWAEIKLRDVEVLIQSCAGLWIEATVENSFVVPGDSIAIKTTIINRSSVPMSVSAIDFPELQISEKKNILLEINKQFQQNFLTKIPQEISYTQPYWLMNELKNFRYVITDKRLIGNADSAPSLSARITTIIEKEEISLTVPIQFKRIDPIEGELYKNIVIEPAISLSLQQHNIIFKNDSMKKEISVVVHANSENVTGIVQLLFPDGWECAPLKQTFLLNKKGDEVTISFLVSPTKKSITGKFSVQATVGEKQYSSEIKNISYSHIPPQNIITPTCGNVMNLDLKIKGTTIGYIMGAGDEIPKALEQMGLLVHQITDDELKNGNLNSYDAIIAGIRAYNTREALRSSHLRLIKYVEQGGNYIVQYQTAVRGETDNLGPYPFSISRDRVTDENAEMKFVNASHPLLTTPNTLTAEDFSGWVQERGLYFANSWDERYQPIFSCADNGENELKGSMLYAKYGKGNYIFTGLSLFRQLPAGVSGAYRLIANMISVGK